MLATIALALVAFPQEPLADQVAVGRRIATAEPRLSLQDLFRPQPPRRSMDEIWGSDRQKVGSWSNGYLQVSTEYVVWVSPALVSRWLGFLGAREHWDDEELPLRWQTVRNALGERRAFVVQLSAFPKLPTYGVGDYERTSPEEIENVRFVYTSGAKTERMEAMRLAQWQSRERGDLEDFPWWQHVAFGTPLIGEFETVQFGEPLPLGDYHRAWYLVWAEGQDADFEVRILSKRKERVAKFRSSK